MRALKGSSRGLRKRSKGMEEVEEEDLKRAREKMIDWV
jgi:hypothetical protein